MTLEIIEDITKPASSLTLNGFTLVEGSAENLSMIKTVLEGLFSLHRATAYEEHGIDKATGTMEHHLVISFHINK